MIWLPPLAAGFKPDKIAGETSRNAQHSTTTLLAA
jgi:hypothetical protein